MYTIYSFKKGGKGYQSIGRLPKETNLYSLLQVVNNKGFKDTFKHYFNKKPRAINYHVTIYDHKTEDRSTFNAQQCLLLDIDLHNKKGFISYVGQDKARNGIDLDLDCVDRSLQSLGIKKEQTSIVETAFGFHIYLHFNKGSLQYDDFNLYKEKVTGFMDNLEQSLNEQYTAVYPEWAGILWRVDKQSFSPNKLIRMPGSQYIEQVEDLSIDRPTRILRVASLSWEMENLADMVELSNAWADPAPTDNLHRTLDETFTPDAEAVQKGCNFVKYCKQHPTSVTEPEWYAMLSVVGRLGGKEKGSALAHEYSRGHPNYTVEETDRKLEHALNSAGPRTCKGVMDVWSMSKKPGGCVSCPYRDVVKSPVLIQGEDKLATEATGFWIVKKDKDGVFKPVSPCYEDLVTAYGRENSYKIDEVTKEVYKYNKDKELWYVVKANDDPKYFMQKVMNPSPSGRHRKEFQDRVSLTNRINIEGTKEIQQRYLNLKNGVFDLDEEILHDHREGFFLINKLPFEYKRGAKSPLFDKFLNDIADGHEDIAQTLKEYMAYSVMVRDCRFHKAMMLYGESGRNGKSTYCKLLENFIGEDNVRHTDVSDFVIPHVRVYFRHALVNIAEEAAYKDLKKEGIIKKLISGDVIEGKELYKNTVSFKNKCKLVLTCNRLPVSNDLSGGWKRRFIIVEFTRTFPLNDSFIPSLMTEASGIFNSLLEARKSLLKRGNFLELKVSEESMRTVARESCPVTAWADEWITCDNKQTQFIPFTDLWDSYKRYEEWANIPMREQVTATIFSRKISIRFKEHRTTQRHEGKRTRGYKGLVIGGVHAQY